MTDRLRTTYIFDDGDLLRIFEGDWDDHQHAAGIYPAGEPVAAGRVAWAESESGWHPLAMMEQCHGVDVIAVILERVDVDAIGPPRIDPEWAIYAGGSDPDNCAYSDGFGDDEVAAREQLQFLRDEPFPDGQPGAGVAVRYSIPGVWMVQPVEQGTEGGDEAGGEGE